MFQIKKLEIVTREKIAVSAKRAFGLPLGQWRFAWVRHRSVVDTGPSGHERIQE